MPSRRSKVATATMPMTKAEASSTGLDLAPDARVGIIAGGGSLPAEVAAGLAEAGHPPVIILVEGQADPRSELAVYEHESLALEDIGSLVAVLRRRRITHLVLAGEIKRRPRLRDMRPSLGLLALIPSLALALAREGINASSP